MIKIKALGHHLCAHHHIYFTFGKSNDQLILCGFGAGGIKVEPPYFGGGKILLYYCLNFFGTMADIPQIRAATVGAVLRIATAMLTVVTRQFVGKFVVSHVDITLYTHSSPPTMAALNGGHITPPVLKKNDLFAFVQYLLHGFLQGHTQYGLEPACPSLVSEVNDINIG